MNQTQIFSQLHSIYVDGARPWDENYSESHAALKKRLGCLSVELGQITGQAVKVEVATGDVYYYSMEVPLCAPRERIHISVDDLVGAAAEAYYLVAYCSLILPVIECRWHRYTVGNAGYLVHENFDLLDAAFLDGHPETTELATKLMDRAQGCGWQILGPEVTELSPPAGWPWPIPSWDYQDGDYLVRDYIFKGMRDY